MKPAPQVAEEIHPRAAMNVPSVPVQVKDPQISDLYKEVRVIRKWVLFIGIVVMIGLVVAIVSILISI